ncbi:UNVERIFIED_CONTAM: hypothetical protein Cloal_2513 [Acetivibrio alkalicellulosi]
MKITDMAMIAMIILLPSSVLLDTSQKNSVQAQNYKERYTNILRVAVEDASNALLYREYSQELVGDQYTKKHYLDIDLNLEYALDRYYETMFMNLNIEGNKIEQQNFKIHNPVKIVTGFDGYHVHTWENVQTPLGYSEMMEIWLPKKPYSHYDQNSNLIINFTLSDFIYVYDVVTGEWIEGYRNEIFNEYPHCRVFEPHIFDLLRRQTIVQMIQDDLERYTIKYNYIAKQYNLGYIFTMPMIKEDEWQNTIEGISFISFIQGLPVKGFDNLVINTYGFGGARISKQSYYYGNIIDDARYYHIEGCFEDVSARFNSRKDAAKEGYYPCVNCKP